MKIPFLFVNGEKFVIYFGRFEFVEYDARWIGENDVGDFPSFPKLISLKMKMFLFLIINGMLSKKCGNCGRKLKLNKKA